MRAGMVGHVYGGTNRQPLGTDKPWSAYGTGQSDGAIHQIAQSEADSAGLVAMRRHPEPPRRSALWWG